MFSRLTDLHNKQVVCIKNGCVLGAPSDVEINSTDGKIESLVILGRLRLFGLLGREEDIVIPWREIEVIGQETILVNTDTAAFIKSGKKTRFPF